MTNRKKITARGKGLESQCAAVSVWSKETIGTFTRENANDENM